MTAASRSRRRLLIGLAGIAVALLVAGGDVWIVGHFGANAATSRGPDNYLNAIACPSAGQCWAVGQVGNAPGGNTLSESRDPLLERETSGHWHTVAARGLPGRKYALESIACPGASDCWAVGGSSPGGSALIAHWTGGAWQLASSPELRGGQLEDVSCASARACWAIGGTQSRAGATANVLEQWNGTGWSTAASLPGGLRPDHISCPAAGRCLALGLLGDTPAAAAYSRGRWTPAPAPAGGHPGATASLFDCASPAMCLAAFPGASPVTDAWDGRAWTTVTGAPPAYPTRLTCSGAGGCWLLGATGKSRPLAWHWQGRGWTPVTVRAPHRHGYLTALACGDRCWGVGGTGGTRGSGASYTYPLVEPLA